VRFDRTDAAAYTEADAWAADPFWCYNPAASMGAGMPPISLIKAFLEQATAQGSRSTVLRPLGWMISICATGALTGVYLKAPLWLIVLFAGLAGLAGVLYIGAYIFCLLTDKDALRTERYSIQKLAIEKGFVGDSIAGVVHVEAVQEKQLMDASSSVGEEGER
jgi:hypothetical protein